jgi:hypothetical protein
MPKRRIVDPVRVQFSVSIRLKRGKKLSPEAIEMLIKKWIKGQSLPRGIKINAIVWKNPERTRVADRDWRGAGDKEAIARLLPAETVKMVHETPEEAQPSLMAITVTQSITINKMGKR